jgi:RNA polymerase sigma-70 factor (ECF subfamily)
MQSSGSITRLLSEMENGTPSVRRQAETEIWHRYFPQLLALARKSIDARTRRREDEEDILQSMYHSFCARLKKGDYELEGRGDLWKLLVTMTLFKTRRAVARHRRQKRDARREMAPAAPSADQSHAWTFEQMDRAGPTPDEAAAFNEEIQARLEALNPALRQIVLWKLEGYTNGEIAGPGKLDCAERTVERKLSRIRDLWTRDQNAEEA